MLWRKKVYKDVLNDLIFYCDAPNGTLLTQGWRKVTKWHIDSDWDIDETWTTTNWYANLATDLATVQSLSFS